MDDTASTPDEGQYTDEQTADGRSTHHEQETVGRYEDTQEPDGSRSPERVQEPGEYTDVDLDGDR